MAVLGDYIKVKHGYAFKGEFFSTDDNGVVLITPGNFAIGGGFKQDKCKFFTSLFPRDYVLHEDDLIVTMTDLSKNIDTLGYSALIPNSNRIYLHNQRIGLVQFLSDKLDKHYLYWFMRTKFYQKTIAGTSSGSTVHHTSPDRICAVEINPPDIVEQIKIANILDNIENKIANNHKINKNLEQQAQALFKSWFLDYEPWDGSVPDSWKHGKLGDFAEIKRGGSPRPIQEYLSDSGLRWLKISDVTSLQTPFVIDIKDHIIEAGLRKTVFLKAGSLVLSNSATPGVPKILDVDSCIHDGWLYFPESKFSKEYLYLYFKYIRQQLVNLSNGSVFNNLKTDILKKYPTILPDKETLQRFDDIVIPMFLQIQNLTRESHKLADMRDTLLPKLMSGKLDVSDIDI